MRSLVSRLSLALVSFDDVRRRTARPAPVGKSTEALLQIRT